MLSNEVLAVLWSSVEAVEGHGELRKSSTDLSLVKLASVSELVKKNWQ